MQIDAISSVNFKSNYNRETRPLDNETGVSNFDGDIQDTFRKATEEAKNNVSVITCIVGALTALGVAKKGSKLVGCVRGAVAEGGKGITEGIYKLSKKITKKIDAPKTQKGIEHIDAFFDKFSNKKDLATESPELVSNFVSTVNAIFGEGSDKAGTKGKKMLDKLHGQNLYLNTRSMFDNLIAATLAYGVADGASDVTEGIIDKKHIRDEVGEHATKKAETIAKMQDMLSRIAEETELADVLLSD